MPNERDIAMFEMFERMLRNRQYFGAGSILSKLGDMLPRPTERPDGFFDAQVRVVPLDNCMHIFVLLGHRDDFWALPGDMVSCKHRDGYKLLTKTAHLSDLYSPDCSTPVTLHFLYAYEAEQVAVA